MTTTATTGRAVRAATLKIGLEIHVELATRSKMFSRAANAAHPSNFDAPPNTLVDPVVAGMPGVLPVMNKRAVEMAMMVGLALNCRIASFTKWDRKSYYYPDLPKGYQISQYDLPLCHDGFFDLPLTDDPAGPTKRIGIVRAHLEEDTGKLGHELPGGARFEGSLVDLNRAGTPLLEIVTAPDFASAEEVVRFARELRHVCKFLGVTEGIMQKGHMRFEPNINVLIEGEDGRAHATPIVEVKNLNSFRSLQAAIEFEFARQPQEWVETGRVTGAGAKRTRGWDDVNLVTVLQREKEDVHDYRYFPDPDLIPLRVDDAWRRKVAEEIPELPLHRLTRYTREYGLTLKEAQQLIDEPRTCFFYERCVRACIEAGGGEDRPGLAESKAGKVAANMVLQYGGKHANARGVAVHDLAITPEQVAGIVALREANTIGPNAADELFGLLCDAREPAAAVAKARGMMQVTDTAALEAWVEQAIAANPKAVESIKAGKGAAIGAIVGAVMKLSGGKADAKAVSEMVKAKVGA